MGETFYEGNRLQLTDDKGISPQYPDEGMNRNDRRQILFQDARIQKRCLLPPCLLPPLTFI